MSTLHAVDDHSLADEDIDLFMLLCQRRGWSDQYLKEIESTEHDELLDLAEMVEALHDSRSAGKKISIAPDFDMDGISSGVLGHAGLPELGFDVELHLPDYRRGREFAPEGVAEIHAKWPDTRVLLTCDGGVNSHRGIAVVRALGWTTLVTDHHEELASGSTADITVDPCRIDETYAHTGICGAHGLYRVIEAYTRVHRPEKLWEIRLLRLFAGLGTVSDVMPVPYENRQLVRDAISIARLLRVAAPKTIPNPWGGFDADPDAIDIDIEQSMLMQLLRTEPHHPVFLRAFEGFAIVLKAFAQAGKIAGDQPLAPWVYLLDAPGHVRAAGQPDDGDQRPPGRPRQPACRPRRFRQRFRPRAEVVRHHHQPGAARRSQRHRTPAGLRRSRREGREAGRPRSSLSDLVGRARGVRCRTWQGGGVQRVLDVLGRPDNLGVSPDGVWGIRCGAGRRGSGKIRKRRPGRRAAGDHAGCPARRQHRWPQRRSRARPGRRL
ncbi:DHH family phosphoesterase [Streptomyces virginiae]|uniref:DHH family phosphoesterase n=1 Tax=Streptomyces virginiae TaxID=1961 RepID=A0ABZ1TJ48_STRVG|nr:DHH family phosphoesterase [Streptomyces virginiae]